MMTTPDELRELADALYAALRRYQADILAAAPAVPQAEPKRRSILQAVARGWCHPKNSSKEMDVDLADAIVDEVMAINQAEPKREPNPDEVICPACTHQFRAIPENVQAQLWAKREPLTARRILEIEDDAIRQWRDNGMIDDRAVVFARMIERAAYERAAQECEPHEDDDSIDRQIRRELAERIRALGRKS